MRGDKFKLLKNLLVRDSNQAFYIKKQREIHTDFATTFEDYFDVISKEEYLRMDNWEDVELFFNLENTYKSIDEEIQNILKMEEPLTIEGIALENSVIYDTLRAFNLIGEDPLYPLYCKSIFETYVILSDGVNEYKIPRTPQYAYIEPIIITDPITLLPR